MIEFAIRRGILLTIAVLVVSVLGVLAAMRIPIQMIPDLEVRTISILTDWPGATPRDVEQEILIEQERYLRNIPNLSRMKSNATTGEARIELEFPFGVDINDALIRVNNALSQVPAYPENVDEPRLLTTSFSTNSFMFMRVEPLPGQRDALNMIMMRDYIEDYVRPRLERIPGVSEVNVGGGAERQIQVLVDTESLAARGLSLADVRRAIRLRNQDISGGDIDSGKRRYLLRTLGRYQDVEALRETILLRRGDALVRLGDVADVRLDHFEIRTHAYVDGLPIIFLSTRREVGSNVIATKQALLPVMAEINRDLLNPAGMQMRLITDDVRYVEASIANVWQNLAIGAVLATLVMFLFLRSVPATLVGVIGIPICTIAAFFGLMLAGRTVNVISLAGVAFAIGMTLDNSIVVLESIQKARRAGRDRIAAALAGTREVWPAVLASTLTTLLVFTPVLFVEEEAGQLYSDVAIAISAAVLASMLVAVTVVPSLSSRLPIGGDNQGDGGDGFVQLRQCCLQGITWLCSTLKRRIALLLGILGFTLWVIFALTPPAEYLPEGEEAKSFSSMYAPAGYNLEEMHRIGKELNGYFLPYINDDPEQYARGETDVPAIAYFNMRVQPQNLRMIAEAKDPAQIGALMAVIDEKFREYPGMRAFSARGSIISSNDGGTRSVNLDISGPAMEELFKVADEAYRRAFDIFGNPQVNAEPSSLTLAQPLLEIKPYWERLSDVGIRLEDLGYAVAVLTDGAYVDEFFMDDQKIDIFLYDKRHFQAADIDRGAVQGLSALSSKPIVTPSGAIVPLSALAEIRETVDTDDIRRINGRRTVTLNIIPPRGVPLESAVETVRTEILDKLRNEGFLPHGVSVDISGASDQLQATRESLGGNFVVAILLSYLLLVAVFAHWGYPVLIMATVPLGIAGGIVGLWLMNAVGGLLPNPISQPFDMITMLGFLILLGTVVNNPILVVDRTRQRLREGCDLQEAVSDAVRYRLRPMLMTTVTTTCGIAPLVFIPGAGTELYRGVGAIVMFGLLFATLVTLVFLPALLVTVLGWRKNGRSWEKAR